MIQVKRIYDAVKNITVSQLPIKEKKEVILQAIDLGVIELYKRFNLDINAVSLSTTANVYVYDIPNTNISQIMSILDSEGKTLTTPSVIGVDYDYRILNYKRILFSKPKNEQLTVIYKASLDAEIKSENDIIDIPLDFAGALIDFVTYRCHITLNNDNLNEVDTHYKRFERTCAELLANGYRQELTSMWKGIPI